MTPSTKRYLWIERFVDDVVMRLCERMEEYEGVENTDALYDAVNETVGFDLQHSIEVQLPHSAREDGCR